MHRRGSMDITELTELMLKATTDLVPMATQTITGQQKGTSTPSQVRREIATPTLQVQSKVATAV